MENTNQNINPPSVIPPAQNVDQLAVDRQKFKENFKKIKEMAKVVLARLWANKKLVYLIGGILGFLLLIIILGLIFGNRARIPGPTRKTPAPNQNTQSPIPSPSDVLGQNEVKLKNINDEIITFDLNQSRLAPPPVDFKISF